MSSKLTDQHYLTTDQYRDSSNIDARIALHQQFSTNPYGWFNWVYDILSGLPAKSIVLELGCGSGTIWKECAHRIPAGWVITLSDLSDGMLDAAWRNLVVTGRNFKFEQIDAQSIPYPDGTFEVVIANHMLYHVPDRPKAISEIRRVLRTGGHLMATTVGEGHLKQLDEWVRRFTHQDYDSFAVDLFTLENGMSQLMPYFSKVELYRYEDSLQVTEIDPLMAYIHSSLRAKQFSESALKELQAELEARLKQDGMIFISKCSGLFEAVK